MVAAPRELLPGHDEAGAGQDAERHAHRLGDPLVVERVLQEEGHAQHEHDRAHPQHQAPADRIFQGRRLVLNRCRGHGYLALHQPCPSLRHGWRHERWHRRCLDLGRRKRLRHDGRRNGHRLGRDGRGPWGGDEGLGCLGRHFEPRSQPLGFSRLQRRQPALDVGELALESRDARPGNDRQNEPQRAEQHHAAQADQHQEDLL